MNSIINNWFKHYSQDKQGVHVIVNRVLYYDFVTYSNMQSMSMVSFGLHMRNHCPAGVTKVRDKAGIKWIIDFGNPAQKKSQPIV